MRAFVALIPPPAALAELDGAVAPPRAAHPDLRWTPPEQWHLTLAFLGEVDEGLLPDLTERLTRAARRHPPLDLAFAGAGRFGDRVLWTRVVDPPPPTNAVRERDDGADATERDDGADARERDDGADAGERESPVSSGRVLRSDRAAPAPPRRWAGEGLRRLAASVGAAARRCGIPVEERPHRPHLTLARARPGAELRPAVALLAGFAGSPWTADAVHLVRSRLGAGPGGTAAHEVVRSWPLGGDAVRPGVAQADRTTRGGGTANSPC